MEDGEDSDKEEIFICVPGQGTTPSIGHAFERLV